jgi:transposase
MRKQINGLAVVVEQQMQVSPFEEALFVFCNRERRILKALYWDRTGFCLWQKRLEKHRFPWPRDAEEAKREIDVQRLGWILGGVDFWGAHEELEYTRVS